MERSKLGFDGTSQLGEFTALEFSEAWVEFLKMGDWKEHPSVYFGPDLIEALEQQLGMGFPEAARSFFLDPAHFARIAKHRPNYKEGSWGTIMLAKLSVKESLGAGLIAEFRGIEKGGKEYSITVKFSKTSRVEAPMEYIHRGEFTPKTLAEARQHFVDTHEHEIPAQYAVMSLGLVKLLNAETAMLESTHVQARCKDHHGFIAIMDQSRARRDRKHGHSLFNALGMDFYVDKASGSEATLKIYGSDGHGEVCTMSRYFNLEERKAAIKPTAFQRLKKIFSFLK